MFQVICMYMSPLSQISLPSRSPQSSNHPIPCEQQLLLLAEIQIFHSFSRYLLRTFQILCKVQAVVTQYFPYIQISLNDSEETSFITCSVSSWLLEERVASIYSSKDEKTVRSGLLCVYNCDQEKEKVAVLHEGKDEGSSCIWKLKVSKIFIWIRSWLF